MKKFTIKTLFLIIPLIAIAYVLQLFIDNCIKHSSLLYYKTWNDIIEGKINTDIIILGSSRAKVQISPIAIDSSLHMKTCNLGMEGTQFNLQYYRFQLYLKHNTKPKYIIQNVDCTSTLYVGNLYQFEQYIPYLNIEIIQKATSEYDVFDKKDFYIPLYKYTHSIFTKQIIINGIKGFIKKTYGTSAYDNFACKNAKWDSTFIEFKRKNLKGFRSTVDFVAKDKFDKLLKYCKNEEIKIILVYAPEYKELQNLIINRDSIVSIYKNFAKKYQMYYLDYSNDSICLDTTNFYNSQHMNVIGVNKFNKKLSMDLKKIVKAKGINVNYSLLKNKNPEALNIENKILK